MIALFLRVGAPTNWEFARILLDEADYKINSVEGVWGPSLKWPRPGQHLDQVNTWCLARKTRHMRLSSEGYYRRFISLPAFQRAVEEQKNSLIRQFWVCPDGLRLMSLHDASEDILDLPTPINLKEGAGVVRDGYAHFIHKLSVPENTPFNVLGTLGPTQM